jgi:hypothetical protein
MTQQARNHFALIVLLVVGATPLFAQSDWTAVRPAPMVTLEIRKLVGLLMLVPAVTLFLLYLFRPRPYVLAGVTSWAAGSVMMLVLSFDSGTPHPADSEQQVSVGRAALGVWAVAALYSARACVSRARGSGRLPRSRRRSNGASASPSRTRCSPRSTCRPPRWSRRRS